VPSSGSCGGTAARQHERRVSMYVIHFCPTSPFIHTDRVTTNSLLNTEMFVASRMYECTYDSSLLGCDADWFLDTNGSTATCCLRLNCTLTMEAVSSPKRSYVGLYTSLNSPSVQTPANCTNCLQSVFSGGASMPMASLWCTCRDRYAMQCALSAPPPSPPVSYPSCTAQHCKHFVPMLSALKLWIADPHEDVLYAPCWCNSGSWTLYVRVQ